MTQEDKIDKLLRGQEHLGVVVTEQHRRQSEEMAKLVSDHEERMHPEMEPDHTEQHKRYGGWLRRIDGAWDKVFGALALFVLGVIGYGLIAIMHDKMGGA